MGWVLEDGHEGYVAYAASDGRTTSMSTHLGVLMHRLDADRRAAAAWSAGRTPTDDDLFELVAYEALWGWQIECSCGWTGGRWSRDQTLPGPHGGHDPDDSYLPDGGTVEDRGHQLWMAHMAPVSLLAAVGKAVAAVTAAREQLDFAVREARAQDPALSWAEIGRAAGISRQSAHERWGSAAS